MHGTVTMVILSAFVFALGHGAGRVTGERIEPWLLAFAAVIIVAALAEGDYWSIFPTGRGVFTANRISAGVAFGAVLLVPYFDERRRELAKRDERLRELGLARETTEERFDRMMQAVRTWLLAKRDLFALLLMIGLLFGLVLFARLIDG